MSSVKLPLFLSIVCAFVASVSPANILSIEFFSSKSHKITFMPLLEELGKRGHNVTILGPIRPFNPDKPVKNVHEILALDWEALDNSLLNQSNPFDPKRNASSTNPFLMMEFFLDICKKSYDLPQVKAIMKEKFDLILLQPSLNECILGMIYKMKSPLVLWSPVGVPSYLVEKIGGHFPSSIIPNVFLNLPSEMSFFQRFFNFGVNLALEALFKFYYEPTMTSLYREKLEDENIPSVGEIMRDQVAMILSNGHFSLHRPKPFFQDVVDVGGIHSRPAKPLPQDLENFIQKGKDHGFIYFSMGSGLKGSAMPEQYRKMFVNVFSQLKQQILWKWKTETMSDLPANVKLSNWFPQQDLLGHPLIKMFITHCGGGSTEEAVYHGCPLIGIPMFGDQPTNANLAKSHGFMVELDWSEITEEKLMSAIQEILRNSQYRNNVKKLSEIFKDQVDKPLSRAVYWIEYVIRYKGAPHLRSTGRKLGFIQYHSIDVIAAYTAITSLAVYLLYKVFLFIGCKTIPYMFTANKNSTSKDNKKSKSD